MSRRECLLRPYVMTMMFSIPLVPVMGFCISLERFLIMSMPLRYVKWPIRYFWRFLAIILGWITIGNLVNIALLWSTVHEIAVKKDFYCLFITKFYFMKTKVLCNIKRKRSIYLAKFNLNDHHL